MKFIKDNRHVLTVVRRRALSTFGLRFYCCCTQKGFVITQKTRGSINSRQYICVTSTTGDNYLFKWLLSFIYMNFNQVGNQFGDQLTQSKVLADVSLSLRNLEFRVKTAGKMLIAKKT